MCCDGWVHLVRLCFSNWLSPLCDCRFLRAAEWPGHLIGWWRAHADCCLLVVGVTKRGSKKVEEREREMTWAGSLHVCMLTHLQSAKHSGSLQEAGTVLVRSYDPSIRQAVIYLTSSGRILSGAHSFLCHKGSRA